MSARINPLEIERFNRDWCSPFAVIVEAIGTRNQLIEAGLAADYMFDRLGDNPGRAGSTEYGDRYRIERRTLRYEHFKLRLEIKEEPRNPHGLSHVDPYKTEISSILKNLKPAVLVTPRKGGGS